MVAEDPGPLLDLVIMARPGARKTEARRRENDGLLELRVQAAPTDGKANREIIKRLSKTLKIPQKMISVSRGLTARKKTIRLPWPAHLGDQAAGGAKAPPPAVAREILEDYLIRNF